jgi:hypothetical protein
MERAGVAEGSGIHSMQAGVAVVQGVTAWASGAIARRVKARIVRMGNGN